ncbi:MAG: hypothetical protein NTY88_07745 [Bacteroidetes bacterium]|nr:hypothetical protein [Bacteroidota bacterium]
MNNKERILLLLLLFSFTSAFSQDTIYTATNILSNVLIRDNQPGFIEYRFVDDEEAGTVTTSLSKGVVRQKLFDKLRMIFLLASYASEPQTL